MPKILLIYSKEEIADIILEHVNKETSIPYNAVTFMQSAGKAAIVSEVRITSELKSKLKESKEKV